MATTEVSSQQGEEQKEEEEEVINAFKEDVATLMEHCPHVSHATAHIDKREDQYQQILLKSKNGMVLTCDEEVIVRSVRKLCNCKGISFPSTSMSWMTAYAKEIHDSQYGWLVMDGNLLYKVAQC